MVCQVLRAGQAGLGREQTAGGLTLCQVGCHSDRIEGHWCFLIKHQRVISWHWTHLSVHLVLFCPNCHPGLASPNSAKHSFLNLDLGLFILDFDLVLDFNLDLNLDPDTNCETNCGQYCVKIFWPQEVSKDTQTLRVECEG